MNVFVGQTHRAYDIVVLFGSVILTIDSDNGAVATSLDPIEPAVVLRNYRAANITYKELKSEV